jgi:hypothetical protein
MGMETTQSLGRNDEIPASDIEIWMGMPLVGQVDSTSTAQPKRLGRIRQSIGVLAKRMLSSILMRNGVE